MKQTPFQLFIINEDDHDLAARERVELAWNAAIEAACTIPVTTSYGCLFCDRLQNNHQRKLRKLKVKS